MSRSRAGFTFVELLVVVVVNATLSALLLSTIVRVRTAAARPDSRHNAGQTDPASRSGPNARGKGRAPEAARPSRPGGRQGKEQPRRRATLAVTGRAITVVWAGRP